MVQLPVGFTLPSEIIRDGQIFHMAMAVPNVEAAMGSLGQALSLDWADVREIDMQMTTASGAYTTPIRAVYSKQGPPYLELLSGQPGSFFSAADGPRLHHVGLIVEDWEAEVERLQSVGMTLHGTLSGGVAFFTNEFGLNLEVMGQRVRGALDGWLFPGTTT